MYIRALIGSLLIVAGQAFAASPDSTLFTQYDLWKNGRMLWTVCGSTEHTGGCYASGFIGPFVTVGSMIEGSPSVNGNVVTRAIYVVDSGTTVPKLYVYKKTDTVTPDDDQVTFTLTETITLPYLVGGQDAKTFIAANENFLFIGTSLSPYGVAVNKKDFTTKALGGFGSDEKVASISANSYGYVSETFADGFYLYGPNGEPEGDGGGASYLTGTTQGIVPVVDIMNAQKRLESHVKK